MRFLVTPALCRAARACLGWTIEEFAATAGVGISTVIAFEAGQRKPMRANLEAMVRAFFNAGVIFIEGVGMDDGKGLRLTRSAETLREILLIGGLKEPEEERLKKVMRCIEQHRAESDRCHTENGSQDVPGRVRSDLATLRDAVQREIHRRTRIELQDPAAYFLEPVLDKLHEMTA